MQANPNSLCHSHTILDEIIVWLLVYQIGSNTALFGSDIFT